MCYFARVSVSREQEMWSLLKDVSRRESVLIQVNMQELYKDNVTQSKEKIRERWCAVV